jgi:hypothetical protein
MRGHHHVHRTPSWLKAWSIPINPAGVLDKGRE